MSILRPLKFYLLLCGSSVHAADELTWPPTLPDGQSVISIENEELLRAPEGLLDVPVARTAPRIELRYYPGQDYPGNPWSNWGDGSVHGSRYYSAIGDHKSPQGSARVYEFNAETGILRQLVDTAEVLDLPEGHYMPGKIHTRVDRGQDGWLYYATHRGSTRVTTDQYHYRGDWILRTHPESRKTEIVVHAPVEKCCIPTGVLDPERLIFYGGTAAGDYRDKTVTFFSFDLKSNRLLHTATPGPRRCMILAQSTGTVHYMDEVDGKLMRYDALSGQPPRDRPGSLGLRAATGETPEGLVYTAGQADHHLWSFDVRTGAIRDLGPLAIGSQTYVATLDADPTGRFLYYIPGAHGGSYRDGSAIIQFDTRNQEKKVIAYLHPCLEKLCGFVPIGTYGSSVSADGSKLFITWNGCRGGPDRRGRYPFNTCALTVVHIPASERQP